MRAKKSLTVGTRHRLAIVLAAPVALALAACGSSEPDGSLAAPASAQAPVDPGPYFDYHDLQADGFQATQCADRRLVDGSVGYNCRWEKPGRQAIITRDGVVIGEATMQPPPPLPPPAPLVPSLADVAVGQELMGYVRRTGPGGSLPGGDPGVTLRCNDPAASLWGFHDNPTLICFVDPRVDNTGVSPIEDRPEPTAITAAVGDIVRGPNDTATYSGWKRLTEPGGTWERPNGSGAIYQCPEPASLWFTYTEDRELIRQSPVCAVDPTVGTPPSATPTMP